MRWRRAYLCVLTLLVVLISLGWVRSHYACDYVHIIRETRRKESWFLRSVTLAWARGSLCLSYQSEEIGPPTIARRNNYPPRTSFRLRSGGRPDGLEPTSFSRILGFAFNDFSSPGIPRWQLWLPHWLFFLFALPLWLALTGPRNRQSYATARCSFCDREFR